MFIPAMSRAFSFGGVFFQCDGVVISIIFLFVNWSPILLRNIKTSCRRLCTDVIGATPACGMGRVTRQLTASMFIGLDSISGRCLDDDCGVPHIFMKQSILKSLQPRDGRGPGSLVESTPKTHMARRGGTRLGLSNFPLHACNAREGRQKPQYSTSATDKLFGGKRVCAGPQGTRAPEKRESRGEPAQRENPLGRGALYAGASGWFVASASGLDPLASADGEICLRLGVPVTAR